MTDRISRAADRLHSAFETGTPIPDLTAEEAPQSRADAFAIQDATFDLLGRTPGAWKVGGSPGTEPTASPIAATTLYPSGQVLASADHRLFGVEAEIAFRLGTDLPMRDAAYEAADLRAAVSSLIVAIEVVESRLADWPDVDPLLALMDFQANDSLVLGTEIAVPESLDFDSQSVRLSFNEETVFEDTGSFKGGDPFALMAWLANHALARGGSMSGRGLQAGDVITTGSWNGVDFAAPGTMARVDFSNLGSAELRFG